MRERKRGPLKASLLLDEEDVKEGVYDKGGGRKGHQECRRRSDGFVGKRRSRSLARTRSTDWLLLAVGWAVGRQGQADAAAARRGADERTRDERRREAMMIACNFNFRSCSSS